jgi:hypothetical protein
VAAAPKERTGERYRVSSTKAVAGEIDAVSVVDETVEDRVGIEPAPA